MPDDHRKRNRLFSAKSFLEVLKILDSMEKIADKHDKTLSQIALRWLLDKEGVSSVIVGASSPEQVDQNMGSLDWQLDKKSHDLLSRISEPLSSDLAPHDSLWNFHPRN